MKKSLIVSLTVLFVAILTFQGNVGAQPVGCVVRVDQVVNVREASSTMSNPVGVVTTDNVEIIAVGQVEGWWKVDGSVQGWVSKDYAWVDYGCEVPESQPELPAVSTHELRAINLSGLACRVETDEIVTFTLGEYTIRSGNTGQMVNQFEEGVLVARFDDGWQIAVNWYKDCTISLVSEGVGAYVEPNA